LRAVVNRPLLGSQRYSPLAAQIDSTQRAFSSTSFLLPADARSLAIVRRASAHVDPGSSLILSETPSAFMTGSRATIGGWGAGGQDASSAVSTRRTSRRRP